MCVDVLRNCLCVCVYTCVSVCLCVFVYLCPERMRMCQCVWSVWSVLHLPVSLCLCVFCVCLCAECMCMCPCGWSACTFLHLSVDNVCVRASVCVCVCLYVESVDVGEWLGPFLAPARLLVSLSGLSHSTIFVGLYGRLIDGATVAGVADNLAQFLLTPP